jgi:hypothetical protein
MDEKISSQYESLRIIDQMIQTAKKEQNDNGKGWIIWGWLLFAASILSWFNIKMEWFSTFFFWNLFGVGALILMAIEVFKHFFIKEPAQVRTYTKDLYEKLNIGFFISMLLIIFSMNLGVHPIKGFALLLGLYGFWILIYGAVLNFKPSITGAYITWAFAFASLFVHTFEWTMLLHAFAVLCGYIIPGHLANREFNRVNNAPGMSRV